MAKIFFLLGLRASGKSSLARAIAAKYEMDFIDSDYVLQQSVNQSIASFVKDQGWEAFRQLEAQVLQSIVKNAKNNDVNSKLIVATGGGIVLLEENRALIKKSGFAVYLKAEPDVLYARLLKNPDPSLRPPLGDSSLLQEIKKSFADREPLYQECANIVLPAELSLNLLSESFAAAVSL